MRFWCDFPLCRLQLSLSPEAERKVQFPGEEALTRGGTLAPARAWAQRAQGRGGTGEAGGWDLRGRGGAQAPETQKV